jgi:hypothetical protein
MNTEATSNAQTICADPDLIVMIAPTFHDVRLDLIRCLPVFRPSRGRRLSDFVLDFLIAEHGEAARNPKWALSVGVFISLADWTETNLGTKFCFCQVPYSTFILGKLEDHSEMPYIPDNRAFDGVDMRPFYVPLFEGVMPLLVTGRVTEGMDALTIAE